MRKIFFLTMFALICNAGFLESEKVFIDGYTKAYKSGKLTKECKTVLAEFISIKIDYHVKQDSRSFNNSELLKVKAELKSKELQMGVMCSEDDVKIIIKALREVGAIE